MARTQTSPFRSLWVTLMVFGAVMLGLNAALTWAQEEAGKRATILTLDGPVTPPVASYLEREIGEADRRGDELVIIEIDTPGGLVTSMETIVKAMRNADTPVVTYVAPEAARALSAGFYILYGSHVAAMAPTTTTGAATPVSIGGDPGGDAPPAVPQEETTPTDGTEPTATDPLGTEPTATPPQDISSDAAMRRKVIESSVAYIRGLAQETGRNVEFAERAVRDGDSITAREALEQNVIEIVASDLDDLLVQLDGWEVTTKAGATTLETDNLQLVRVIATLAERILKFIADPNVAAILFSLGTLGLVAEIWNPGSIFPGVFGALCLALAFYSFQVLPANVLFLALMGLGIILITIEAFTPSFGIVGGAGIVLFMAGLYFLFPAEFRVDEGLIVGLGASLAGILALILIVIVGSRSGGPLIGQEAIKRREGTVQEWDPERGEGYVIVDGERWRARSKENFEEGDRIKVTDMDGIILIIKRASAGGVQSLIPNRAKS